MLYLHIYECVCIHIYTYVYVWISAVMVIGCNRVIAINNRIIINRSIDTIVFLEPRSYKNRYYLLFSQLSFPKPILIFCLAIFFICLVFFSLAPPHFGFARLDFRRVWSLAYSTGVHIILALFENPLVAASPTSLRISKSSSILISDAGRTRCLQFRPFEFLNCYRSSEPSDHDAELVVS